MNYVRPLAIALLVLTVLVVSGQRAASGATQGVPDSMASMGDSITRAFNADPNNFGDQPQNSWSTGTSSSIASHYFRILQSNSAISGKNFNLAVSGAKMAGLNGQATNVNAIVGGVEYVTILMGANDVCTTSEGTMTAVDTFHSQLVTAMNTLTTGTPGARIFLLSIPDVFNLWQILHTNSSARSTWGFFNICQSLLANPTSMVQEDVDRRARVRLRNIEFNTQLAEVCALYAQCKFDNNGVFNQQFVPADVSTLDYFHPSLQGQTNLAAGTWQIFDMDADGWSTGVEGTIGTDPLDNCADNSTDNTWPADVNNDGFSDITDISTVAASFGLAVPPAPARYNIAPDPPDVFVDIADIAKVAGMFGKSC